MANLVFLAKFLFGFIPRFWDFFKQELRLFLIDLEYRYMIMSEYEGQENKKAPDNVFVLGTTQRSELLSKEGLWFWDIFKDTQSETTINFEMMDGDFDFEGDGDLPFETEEDPLLDGLGKDRNPITKESQNPEHPDNQGKTGIKICPIKTPKWNNYFMKYWRRESKGVDPDSEKGIELAKEITRRALAEFIIKDWRNIWVLDNNKNQVELKYTRHNAYNLLCKQEEFLAKCMELAGDLDKFTQDVEDFLFGNS